MEETIDSFRLREIQCAGAPVRDPDGDLDSKEGQDWVPLSVRIPIFISDNVFNGQRPLACPHIIRGPDRDYCGAWIGVAKNPHRNGVVSERYKQNEIPPCQHAYRVAKK